MCSEQVQIGRPMIRHMKRMHLCECSVVVTRILSDLSQQYKPATTSSPAPAAQTVPVADTVDAAPLHASIGHYIDGEDLMMEIQDEPFTGSTAGSEPPTDTVPVTEPPPLKTPAMNASAVIDLDEDSCIALDSELVDDMIAAAAAAAAAAVLGQRPPVSSASKAETAEAAKYASSPIVVIARPDTPSVVCSELAW